MNKYFTVALSGVTPEQEKLIAARWAGYGWWHGVTNFWLLRDHHGTFSAASIRDAIREIAPHANLLVIEIDPKMWAGGVMTEANRNWLRNYFPPEGA